MKRKESYQRTPQNQSKNTLQQAANNNILYNNSNIYNNPQQQQQLPNMYQSSAPYYNNNQMNQQQLQMMQQQQYQTQLQNQQYDINNNNSNMYNSAVSYGEVDNSVQNNNSNMNKSRMTNKSYVYREHPSSFIAPKVRYDEEQYKDNIFGIVMSNVHSATSLQKSVPRYALSYDRRFKDKPYQGYDPKEWRPQSIFKSRDQVKQITMRHGQGMLHGHTLTSNSRIDFTNPYKNYPGPGQYQRPILKDKLAKQIQLKKWKSLQQRRQQLGMPSYNVNE